MKFPKLTMSLVSVATVVMLTACGGGGGGDSTASSGTSTAPVLTASPEGAYVGAFTSSTGGAFQMLVLENGEVWALYGTQSPTLFSVAGFIQGVGTTSGNAYTSADVRDFGASPPIAGTLTSTFDATARTISGTLTAGTSKATFTGGPSASSLYNYNTPASLSTIAGNWSLSSLSGLSTSLAIASNGAMSGQTSGCTFQGTITPRSSGKNVFNASLTFGAAPCTTPGQIAAGIGLSYPLSTGKTQLLFVVTNSTKTTGTVAFGVR